MAGRAAIRAALERRVEQAVAALATGATAELIAATPVDTGWARANWVPSVGAPAAGTVGSPEAPSGAAQAAGLAEVVRYKLEDGSAFVANNVPYIRRLDAGHSAQAPAGFVRTAIAKAVGDAAEVLP